MCNFQFRTKENKHMCSMYFICTCSKWRGTSSSATALVVAHCCKCVSVVCSKKILHSQIRGSNEPIVSWLIIVTFTCSYLSHCHQLVTCAVKCMYSWALGLLNHLLRILQMSLLTMFYISTRRKIVVLQYFKYWLVIIIHPCHFLSKCSALCEGFCSVSILLVVTTVRVCWILCCLFSSRLKYVLMCYLKMVALLMIEIVRNLSQSHSKVRVHCMIPIS